MPWPTPMAERTARPALHLTASGWLNDPLGVTWRGDRYHLFHQAVPDRLHWQSECHWAHASSPDLVTWTSHPTALAPDAQDHGCWSGAVHVSPVDGAAVLFYTSVNPPDLGLGVVRTARPDDDDWIRWRKGPIAVRPPVGEGLHTFRDPDVFRDGEIWRMLVGAGYRDGRAAVLSYTSPDLATWTYDGPIAERSSQLDAPLWTGAAWECPHLISFGGRDVLLVSVWDRSGQFAAAATGSYAAGRHTIDRWTRLTYGPGHYAPTVFTDAQGCSCVMFWLRDAADHDQGWAGALSIPYRLDVAGGELRLAPHPQIRAARRPDPRRVLGLDWGLPGHPPSGTFTLRSTTGLQLVTLNASDGVLVLRTPAATEQLPLGSGPVHLLLDTSILEVCTGPAVAGLTVPGLTVPGAAPDLAVLDATNVVPWW